MFRLARLLPLAFAAAPLLAAAQSPYLGDQRLAPIDDPLRVEFRAPPADLSLEKMRQTISIVAAARGWKILGESAGVLQLTRTVNDRHMMKIELAYDPAGYDIRYLDSAELLYREVAAPGKQVRAIHRNYNVWIRDLAVSINSGLAVSASLFVAPAPRIAWSPKPAPPAAAPGDAAPAARAQRASERLPQPGDYWKYSFRDERYRRSPEHFVVEVTDVRGWKVTDLLEREKGDAALRLRKSIDAEHLAFVGRRLSPDYFTFELAPYLAASEHAGSLKVGEVPGGGGSGWKMHVSAVRQDRVQVPAGTFDALRVEIAGTADIGTQGTASPRRLLYTIWYAPETKRYVMMRHQTWTLSGSLYADEIVRLEEYRLK